MQKKKVILLHERNTSDVRNYFTALSFHNNQGIYKHDLICTSAKRANLIDW